jgi:hypothetical protein
VVAVSTPIASTLVSSSSASRTAPEPRAMNVRRAAPPAVHLHDGRRPGNVVRR